MVKDLLSDRREHAHIQEATALIYLDELLDEIVDVTAKIERNYLARLNDRDNYIVNGQSLGKAAYKDLRVLVVVLEASYNTCTSEEQREQIVALSSSLNAALQEFHTLLKMRNTKRKNKKETAAAVKELIDNELKGCKQKLEESNLPRVVYDEFKIAPSTCSGTTPITRSENGNLPVAGSNIDRLKPKPNCSSDDFSTYKNDKGKTKIVDDRGLPPISKN